MIAIVLLALVSSTAAAPSFNWWPMHIGRHHSHSNAFAPTDNIPALAEKLGATTLVSLVKAAGLADALSGPGPFTVFGPTNDAFATFEKQYPELVKNITIVKSILLYHVISGDVYSSQLSNDLQAQSLLPEEKIRINIYTHGEKTVATAEGSPIVLTDQNATNGVIHVIDRVMLPPIGTIPAFLTSSYGKDFSTLLAAVEAAGLVATLSGPGPFTVFAPTNEAFAKIPKETLDNLLKNKTQLTKVLTYHVVGSTQWSAGLYDGEVVKTVEGSTVTVRAGAEGVSLMFGEHGQSRVVFPDVSASNGVIHAIDTVLLPSDL